MTSRRTTSGSLLVLFNACHEHQAVHITEPMIIAGFSLGDIADELINWINKYQDDTDVKPVDSGTSGYAESAQQDILLHMVTATLGYLMFFWMTLGAYIWAWSFLKVENAGDDLVCEIDNRNDYSGIPAIVGNIVDKASCLENVQRIFTIGDVNGDGILDRCEDMNFQYFAGQEIEFARKFAGAYTRQSVSIVCETGRFRY